MVDPLTHLLMRLDNARHAERRVLALMYHGTAPSLTRDINLYSTTAAAFRQHLEVLERFGWETRCLRDLNEPENLPSRTVLLTFDDGIANNFEGAFVPLAEKRMVATWFVVTGKLGQTADWMDEPSQREALLKPEQVKTMAEAGMEIGSHTVSHADLAQLGAADVRRELTDSKNALESLLGDEVSSLAYPFGNFREDVKDIARACGYRFGCTTRPGWIRDDDDPMDMRRLTVFKHDTVSQFARKFVIGTNRTQWSRMANYAVSRMPGLRAR